jgi:lipoate-protein ligase A
MEKKEVKKKAVKKDTKLPLITRPRGGTTVDNRSLSRRFKNVKL